MSSEEICDALIWTTDSFSSGKKTQYLLFFYIKINDEYYYHTIFDENGSDFIGACSKIEHEKMISESEKFLHLTESEFVSKFESTPEIYNSTIAFAKKQIERTRKDFEDDTKDMKKYLLKNYVISYLNRKLEEKMEETTKLSIEILKLNEETKEKTKIEIDQEKMFTKLKEGLASHKLDGKFINLDNENSKEVIIKENNIENKNTLYDEENEDSEKSPNDDEKNMKNPFDLIEENMKNPFELSEENTKNMKNPFEINGLNEENKLEIRKIFFNFIKEINNIIIKLENNEIDEDTFKKMSSEIKKKLIAESMENKSIQKYINSSPYGEYINSYLHLYYNKL